MGNALQRDAQRDHKGDDDVSLDAEGPEDRGPGFCHCLYTGSILPNDAGEHKIEPGEDQRGE